MAKRMALRAERTKIGKPCMDQLITLLDTRQRILWQGHLLAEVMESCFRRFQLDAGQVSDLRSRCNLAAKAIVELPASGKVLATTKIKGDLARRIVLEVLTPDQRERVVGTPGKNETPAQRAERIKLAAMGFAGRRLGDDIDRSQRSVQLALDNHAKEMESRRADGLALGETIGKAELMDLINQARGSAGVPTMAGYTKLNEHAQEIADHNETQGRRNRSHLSSGTVQTAYGIGFWVREYKTPERALRALLSYAGQHILSPSYNIMGTGRRGKTWAVMLSNKTLDDGLIRERQ